MQKNIFLEVEYKGTAYFGFQIQNKKGKREVTVQEAIEDALKKLFRKNIRITFSGRTDRGVHARAQGVNFPVDTKIALDKIKTALNSFLPWDIRVKKIKYVSSDFHARFSARSKIYRYIIRNTDYCSVFDREFSWHIPDSLDLSAMRSAARLLIGKKDFSLFAKEVKRYQHCIRDVRSISIKKRGTTVVINIEAQGFLRAMARNIVSFLVKAGRAKIPLKDVPLILQKKTRYHAIPAPACGLYLWKVCY